MSADQLLGLAAGGAVADGDQLDPVLRDQLRELGLRAAHVVLAAGRDRRSSVASSLPVRVDHRDLHAGADAGIEPHRRARAGGRGQQQVLEIAGEDVDRLVLGALAQLAPSGRATATATSFTRQVQPATSRSQWSPGAVRPMAFERRGDHRARPASPARCRRRRPRCRRDSTSSFAAAQHGERAVARHRRPASPHGRNSRENFAPASCLPSTTLARSSRAACHVGRAGGRAGRRSRRAPRR